MRLHEEAVAEYANRASNELDARWQVVSSSRTGYFDLPGFLPDVALKVLSFDRQLFSLPFWLARSAFSERLGEILTGSG